MTRNSDSGWMELSQYTFDIDPFLEETEEKGKSNDDWDHFHDFNINDIPLLGKEGLPTFKEVLLPQVHHEFLLWEGCNRDAKSRYNTRLAQLLPRHIYSPCVVNWDVLNRMGCDGEIDDKSFKFRLGGRGYSLTLLEFAQSLGLYQAVKLEEEGFNVYFEGGLCSNEHFNAQDYWLSISREENLGLSRSHTSTIRNLILRVINKMITYGLCQRTTGYDKVQKNDLWLLSMFDARHQNGYANVAWVIARWMKRKGAGTQKESQICRGQFILKIARKDLINSDGKLILEDLQPGVPRVGIPRPPRASMQDLYDRMGRMEIHQEAIERMEYRVVISLAKHPPQYQQQQQQDDDEWCRDDTRKKKKKKKDAKRK
ncbi:hypothetical protein Tco_1184434 [Tanacetum coccineum]